MRRVGIPNLNFIGLARILDMNFSELNIEDALVKSLRKMGIKEPTSIQKKIIPLILNGRSIVAESNTGTGKTLSYLIPIMNMILNKEMDTVLVLAPTRELVIQINSEAEKIISNMGDYDITTLPIYGGKDIKSQINRLKGHINIIIATPGRLLDHLNRGSIDLSDVSNVVIDEADQMLLMGFRKEIDHALQHINEIKSIMLLSATIDSKVKKLAYRYDDNIQIISSVSESEIPRQIEQEFIFTTDRQKFDDFCNKVKEDNPFMAIVFCRTKARVDNLDLKFAQLGFNCDKIHSDISQAKRERIIKNFRDMKIQFLISTDLASRGLDIEGITHIYNYDFPESEEDYIHRIGRTGRIGNSGKACSFVTEKNMDVYDKVKSIL